MLKERITTEVSNFDDYAAENAAVAHQFLQSYMYDNWYYENNPEVKNTIELIISPYCNLGCKYCYWQKYHKHLYPDAIYDQDKVKENLLLVLKWLDKNKFQAPLEIFTGEVFAQDIGFECLDIIYDYEKNVDERWRVSLITIPTNFSWIVNDELIDKVATLQQKLEDINIELSFSASFDGKYEESNRPYAKDIDYALGAPRTDEFYDKMFETVVKVNSGLHPMVYSEGIEKWKDNFLWFQEMMEKYDIPWYCLYLLEVRNENWNVNSIHELEKFIEFLFEWTYDKLDRDKDRLYEFVIKDGFNMLSSVVSRVPRGLTCSSQQLFCIRLGDLSVPPCHRTSYPQFMYGQFKPTEDENVLEFVPDNVEMMVTFYGLHRKTLNYCADCPVNHLCVGPCLGSNYESNRNLFTPTPTVCAMEQAKIRTIVKMFMKYGIYYDIYNIMSGPQKIQMKNLLKEIQDGSN